MSPDFSQQIRDELTSEINDLSPPDGVRSGLVHSE